MKIIVIITAVYVYTEVCDYTSLKRQICSILQLVLIIQRPKLLYDQNAETNSVMKHVHAAFILNACQ